MSLGISKTLGLLHHQNDGSSLYQHLCETLSRLKEAEDPYKSFEMLSTYVRDMRFPAVTGSDLEVPEADPRAPARRAWVATTQELTAIPADAQLGDVADFWAQSRMLAAGGLGFSDQECYALALSIRNLAHRRQSTAARFWGKILGTKSDYYIAELELSGADMHNRGANPLEEFRDDYVEPRGVGANQYVYFVTSSATGEWEQLPNAVPAQIKRSRDISKFFTGDLNAKIWSHPSFPWTERELLRSMIARITCSTVLAPDGFYELQGDEDNQKVAKKPGFTLGGESAATPDKWVHARPYLRLNGRVAYPKEVDSEDVPEEERTRLNKLLEAQRETDVNPGGGAPTAPAVLTGVKDEIDEHTGNGKPSPWLLVKNDEKFPDGRFRILGDPSTYNFPDKTKSYAVTVIESLRFPGAYTVAQGDNHCNVYLGYGVKKQRAFLPLQEMAPGPIMEEPVDLKELIQEPIEEDLPDDEVADEEDEDAG